jgi:hypothetical protein
LQLLGGRQVCFAGSGRIGNGFLKQLCNVLGQVEVRQGARIVRNVHCGRVTPQRRCRLGATVDKPTVEQCHKLVQFGSRLEMFGEQIGRIGLASNLEQLELLASQALLDPQGMAFQVSKFPKPLTPSRANGCRRVCPDAQGQCQAHVAVQRLESHADANAAHDAVVLRLAGAQRQ